VDVKFDVDIPDTVFRKPAAAATASQH
jgi:hypothetical protein